MKCLNEKESKKFLSNYGIPVVAEISALNEDEALKASCTTGYPVVIKGLGERLLHKTERNLVHLNLKNDLEVKAAYKIIYKEAKDDLEAVIVQPYLKGRREFVAGVFKDDMFGYVIMFGLGGIFTEALSDIVFRVAPINRKDAKDMIEEIKAKALLSNFRGDAAVDKETLIKILTGLSDIVLNNPDIKEIDINPLLVTQSGSVYAVDALVVFEDKTDKKEFLPPVDPTLLKYFFYPKTIAFIGASNRIGKWGCTLFSLAASSGYKGEIYLVNHKGGVIAERNVYRSVDEISKQIDLAIVTIPAQKVFDLIPQFKEKGIKAMLLITSGFGETGQEGKTLEKKLVDLAREAGIFVMGPNTMGICNPHINLYCTGVHARPASGSTAIVSQSGNMGTQFLVFAEQQGIGIRGFCGSGNEAMITIEDYMEAFEQDDLTQTIMLYIESVKNGRRFFESALRVSKKKPIVLLKGGETDAGLRAASTHTGAMASNSRVFEAMCRQAGIIKVEQPMDLLDLAATFSSLPLPRGKRAAIMTLGGGWGVVTADLCSKYGLNVPELSEEIILSIDKILPPYWSRTNPVDLVGENDTSIFVTVMEELLKWDGCDAVINLGIIGRCHMVSRLTDSIKKADKTYSDDFLEIVNNKLIDFEKKYIENIIDLMEQYKKPIFGVSLIRELNEKHVNSVEGKLYKAVVFPTPERAAKTFAKMYEYYSFLNKEI